MSYKVAVGNPFDGLDDENEDPKHRTPKPKMAPAEKASDAPKTVKAKPEAAASKAPAQPAATTQKPASAPVQKPADASLKKKPASQNPARRDGNNSAPRNENGDNAARRDYQKDKNYERKDRGPRSDVPRRGRQFDRRSGTGRPPTENKKGGSGAGNWGDETKEGIVAAEAKATEAVESPAVERDADASAETKKEEEVPKEPEGISYDEYLAKKAAPTAESLKLRSAGEGVAANKAWSAYTVLEKGTDDKNVAKSAQPTKEVKDKESKEDVTAGLLNFRIARDDGDRYEGRGGRGGRGRGSSRGSRGRGGRGDGSRAGRGSGGSAPAFNPADFPSLNNPQ